MPKNAVLVRVATNSFRPSSSISTMTGQIGGNGEVLLGGFFFFFLDGTSVETEGWKEGRKEKKVGAGKLFGRPGYMGGDGRFCLGGSIHLEPCMINK